MRRLYDYNMKPIGYISDTENGKRTAYDSNYGILGYYFTETDKTYDHNMRLVGRGDLLSVFFEPPRKG